MAEPTGARILPKREVQRNIRPENLLPARATAANRALRARIKPV